ncbi:hypothetical protein C6P41_003314 [Kluyveromyces marxianus]|nr:hypothetical protein C6P43_000478 [Kluyveromyces marxianus]KAG0683193.1 hypothetical protein C6P41_003314 [Kluyveromyces marxianus]
MSGENADSCMPEREQRDASRYLVDENISLKGYSVGLKIEKVPTDTTPESKFRTIKKMELIVELSRNPIFHCVLIFSAFVCGFGYNLDYSLRNIFAGYATNDFSHHSLLSTIQVVNGVSSAVAQVIFARLSDYYGRIQMFFLVSCFYIVGTILQSQSKNVQMYASGAFFYSTGYVGVYLMVLVILSDFSTLNWRLFYIHVPDWAFIITTWVSGNIVDAAKPVENWSWDIGMWAFIFPLCSIPFLSLLFFLTYRTKKSGRWSETTSTRDKKSIGDKTCELFWSLDIVGLLLLSTSAGCLLVPLTTAGGVVQKWRNSKIIAVLVLGFVLAALFFIWEAKFSKTPILSTHYVSNRGIWAPLVGAFFMQCAYLITTDYMYPLLLVTFNETPSSATRIASLPNFAAVTASPFVALFVVKYRRLKLLILFGTVMYFISFALLYNYRGGSYSRSGLIAATVLMGSSTAFCAFPLNVSLQSVSSHDQMALITACFFAVSRLGYACGSAISGAIWTQIMYKEISSRLSDPAVAPAAFSSPYEFIASYPWGTLERMAVVEAYKQVQKKIMIAALTMLVPLLIMVFLIRDPKLYHDRIAPCVDSEGNAEIQEADPLLKWYKVFNIRGHKTSAFE